MFGIGFTELALIMFVALIFIGPKRLPEIAKSLGKAYFEFQKNFTGVKEDFEKEVLSAGELDEDKKEEF